MQLWKRLYGTVWLAFFSCMLIPRWTGLRVGLSAHVILGLAMIVVTLGNMRSLAAMPVPARLKRISKTTVAFAILQIVCGLTLGLVIRLAGNLAGVELLLRGAHVVCALAILAQSSSLATAYDMWEEKEFGEPIQQ
jgi:hypothetical protein